MGLEKSNTTRMYWIGIVSFFLSLNTLIGAPVLPRLSAQLGAPNTVIPIILSSTIITVVVLQFFTGSLSDRYSRKKLILIGTLFACISSFLILVVNNWWQLLALRITGGIAEAIAMPALLTITATLSEKSPGKFFGILRASQGLSYAIGPLIGGAFSFVSLRMPFLFEGILSLVTLFIVFILIEDNIIVHTERPNLLTGFKSIFTKKRMYLYLLMGISAFWGFGIYSTFVPTRAQNIGLNPFSISVIMSVGALLYSGMSATIGRLSDRYGRKIFVISSQIIIIASSVGLVFLDKNFLGLLLCYGLFCLGEATAFLISFVYATKLTNNNKHIGSIMGAFDSVIDSSLFLAPLIGISVYSLSNDISLVFLLGSVPAIAGLITFSIWLKSDT
jgi:MFS transporter, DHA1 family, multidrug resistance protein